MIWNGRRLHMFVRVEMAIRPMVCNFDGMDICFNSRCICALNGQRLTPIYSIFIEWSEDSCDYVSEYFKTYVHVGDVWIGNQVRKMTEAKIISNDLNFNTRNVWKSVDKNTSESPQYLLQKKKNDRKTPFAGSTVLSLKQFNHFRWQRKKNRQRQNIIEWRNWGEKTSKHQRKLNVPEFERKIVKKEQTDTGKKATCWGNDGERANESNDKMKKKKIILNYLCVTLVYDAYGIRGQLCVWKSVHNFLGALYFNVYKISNIVSLIRPPSLFSSLHAPFNVFAYFQNVFQSIQCVWRCGKVKHIRHLVLHTNKL